MTDAQRQGGAPAPLLPPPSAPSLQAVPLRWCLQPLVRLHWRRWGEEWVVYDEASGFAHRLDTLRATALLLLDEAPADQEALTRRVDAELETGDPDRLGQLLGPVLAELESASLIGRVP